MHICLVLQIVISASVFGFKTKVGVAWTRMSHPEVETPVPSAWSVNRSLTSYYLADVCGTALFPCLQSYCFCWYMPVMFSKKKYFGAIFQHTHLKHCTVDQTATKDSRMCTFSIKLCKRPPYGWKAAAEIKDWICDQFAAIIPRRKRDPKPFPSVSSSLLATGISVTWWSLLKWILTECHTVTDSSPNY